MRPSELKHSNSSLRIYFFYKFLLPPQVFLSIVPVYPPARYSPPPAPHPIIHPCGLGPPWTQHEGQPLILFACACSGRPSCCLRVRVRVQGGLSSLGGAVLLIEQLGNTSHVSRVIESATPTASEVHHSPQEPGVYHVLTYGLLVDQLVRRVDPSHRSVADFFVQEVARPLHVEGDVLPTPTFEQFIRYATLASTCFWFPSISSISTIFPSISNISDDISFYVEHFRLFFLIFRAFSTIFPFPSISSISDDFSSYFEHFRRFAKFWLNMAGKSYGNYLFEGFY